MTTFVNLAYFFMYLGNNRFSKEERLCSDMHIANLFNEGTSFICYPLRVIWKEYVVTEEKSVVKVLLSVPKKKIRFSVGRNRAKRLLREAYRQNKSILYINLPAKGINIDICFLWLSPEIYDLDKITIKMQEALKKISGQIKSKE